MEIIQQQLALFFKNQFGAAFEELALKIKSKLGNTDAQYIPLPPDAIEFPRLILPYKDRNLSLNFSKNRVDIFFKDSGSLSSIVQTVTSILIDDYKISIDRVGFVQRSFFESDINTLLNLIVDTRRPVDTKELSIRINVPKEIGDYSCNNIESLNFVSATKIENGVSVDKKGLLVEKDINTLNEKRSEYIFNGDNIPALIQSFSEEAKNLILL